MLAAIPLLAAVAATTAPATYVVTLTRIDPPAFAVKASFPSGTRLDMDTTRPGDLPALLEKGWPALVTGLRVTDAAGQPVEAAPNGAAGWKLSVVTGPLTAEYEVDTKPLAAAGWPAPREAVLAEPRFMSIVGRALFVTTDATGSAEVSFELPAGWVACTPWERAGATFHVRSVPRLRENLLAFSRSPAQIVDADGFRIFAFPRGSWHELSPEIKNVLGAHAKRFVAWMGIEGREKYVAVLLPQRDEGAESYRQSLALSFPEEPSLANRARWANLLGHELFHFWNGWLLKGEDYASSQWFQEGFTEYAANLSTVSSGLMTPEDFRNKLATHVANYRRLATPLAAPGTRKGPPLYSGGALVALAWDLAIREQSDGGRTLGDFLRSLSRRCGGGERAYKDDDLVAALSEAAPRGDWTAFLKSHVRGTTPLPLDETLGRIGLRLVEAEGQPVRIEEAKDATDEAKRRWRQLVGAL